MRQVKSVQSRKQPERMEKLVGMAEVVRDGVGGSSTGGSYNFLPGALFKSPTRLSPPAKAVFAVLWREAQKANPFIISDQKIRQRAGLGRSKITSNIKKHMTTLERTGFIKRTGRTNQRHIEVLPLPDEPNYDLTIPSEIHQLDISTAKKFVITVLTAFPAVEHWHWYHRRIQMSANTFIYHAESIAKRFVPPDQLGQFFDTTRTVFCRNLVSFLTRIYMVKVGIDFGKGLSKDKLTACGRSGGDNMETLDSPDYSKINYRKYQKPSPEPKISPEDIDELNAVMSLPGIVRHKKGTKAYAASARVIRVLKHSAKHTLGSQQLTRIRSSFKGRDYVNRGQVEEFLGKKFDADERMELYRRLSMDRNKTGQKPMSLADALISYTGYCTLLHLWYLPPKLPKVVVQYTSPDYIDELVDMGKVACQKDDAGTEKSLHYNLSKLWHFWLSEVKPHYNEEEAYHYKSYFTWIKYMLEYWSYRYNYTPTPGWFKSGSKPVGEWRQWTKEGESHDAGQIFDDDDGEFEY